MFPPKPPKGADPRMYFFLFLLTLGTTLGYQGWTLLYTNFARLESAHLSAADNGLGGSRCAKCRELLGILIIPLLLVMKEHRVAAVAALATGLGTALTGFFPSFVPVILTTLLMSFGFHFFEAVNQSLLLQYFDVRTTPVVMGKLRALRRAAASRRRSSCFLLRFSAVYDDVPHRGRPVHVHRRLGPVPRSDEQGTAHSEQKNGFPQEILAVLPADPFSRRAEADIHRFRPVPAGRAFPVLGQHRFRPLHDQLCDQLVPQPAHRADHQPYRRAQAPQHRIFHRHSGVHRLRHHGQRVGRGRALRHRLHRVQFLHRPAYFLPEDSRTAGHRPDHGRGLRPSTISPPFSCPRSAAGCGWSSVTKSRSSSVRRFPAARSCSCRSSTEK